MRFYFLEIKNRLILVFLVQISTFLSLYYHKSVLLFILVHPIFKLGSLPVYYFIFTDIAEPFSVYLNSVIFINKQLVMMYSLYHFCIFASPALYKLEIVTLVLLTRSVFLLWLISASTTNFFLIPWTWLFFSDHCSSNCCDAIPMYFEARLVEYLKFYISFYWVNFLYFQFVGFLFFALNLPQTTLKFIQRYRKFFYFCFSLIAAITCPDVFSQIFFAIVLIFTYELSLIGKLLSFR